jgi:peptidyl-prolyl cis-trans isomerase B (cyclophilin B)
MVGHDDKGLRRTGTLDIDTSAEAGRGPMTQPSDQPPGPPPAQYPPPPSPYPQIGPPAYPPPYQPPPPYNTYAILALVLAIFVLPPLGIYFGNQAKKQIAVNGERGIELANAAVIVGWVMSILMLAFLTIWCLLFGSIMFGFLGIFGSAVSNVPR